MPYQIVDGKAVKSTPQPDAVEEFTLEQLQNISQAKADQILELQDSKQDVDDAIAAILAG